MLFIELTLNICSQYWDNPDFIAEQYQIGSFSTFLFQFPKQAFFSTSLQSCIMLLRAVTRLTCTWCRSWWTSSWRVSTWPPSTPISPSSLMTRPSTWGSARPDHSSQTTTDTKSTTSKKEDKNTQNKIFIYWIGPSARKFKLIIA